MTDGIRVREPFHAPAQQHRADVMGMFVFLATELMLFGGIFLTIFVVRLMHPQETVEASKQLHIWIGAANTVILLTSSALVAAAVSAARRSAVRRCAGLLSGAAVLGLAFLGLKAIEYYVEYADGVLPGISDPARFSGPVERLFMDIYLVATALHAVHVSIGIAVLATVAVKLARATMPLPARAMTVEVAGLYWHLVDVIWVFLYPALYLAR